MSITKEFRKRMLCGEFIVEGEKDSKPFITVNLDSLRITVEKLNRTSVHIEIRYIYEGEVIGKTKNEFNVGVGDTISFNTDPEVKIPWRIYLE
jgi:hypothetical protein